MLLEKKLLTLSMGMGLKLPPFMWLDRYVSLQVFEMAWLTLFMGMGLKWPQILTLYMLDWKGLVLGIPKIVSFVDVGLV